MHRDVTITHESSRKNARRTEAYSKLNFITILGPAAFLRSMMSDIRIFTDNGSGEGTGDGGTVGAAVGACQMQTNTYNPSCICEQ